MTLPDLLDACRTDLDRIEDDLRWAHSAGWDVPTTPNWDGEHGVDLATDPEQRDANAPTYDIGIGDHRAREAFRAAGQSLARVEELMDRALVLCAQRRQLPVLNCPDRDSSLPYLRATIEVLRWRLSALEADTALIDRKTQAKVTDLLRTILGRMARIGRVPEPNRRTTTATVTLCGTCGIRARVVDKRGHLKGKECRTCEDWRARHCSTRPRSLDGDPRLLGEEAKSRRLARDDGYGAA